MLAAPIRQTPRVRDGSPVVFASRCPDCPARCPRVLSHGTRGGLHVGALRLLVAPASADVVSLCVVGVRCAAALFCQASENLHQMKVA